MDKPKDTGLAIILAAAQKRRKKKDEAPEVDMEDSTETDMEDKEESSSEYDQRLEDVAAALDEFKRYSGKTGAKAFLNAIQLAQECMAMHQDDQSEDEE